MMEEKAIQKHLDCVLERPGPCSCTCHWMAIKPTLGCGEAGHEGISVDPAALYGGWANHA